MEKEKNKRKKTIKGIIISIGILIIIYLGMTIYFTNHLYFGSEVNSISVSGKTVAEAEKQLPSELDAYKLVIEERDGKKEEINGADIKLKYESNGGIQKLKERQNPFGWISAFFNSSNSKIKENISYDKELLKKQMDSLECLTNKSIVEPKEPSFKYENNKYIIIDEVKGNKLDKSLLEEKLVNSINNMDKTISLESANCYEKPQYTATSQKVIDTQNLLNKYVSSKVTYNLGSKKQIVDGAIINKWLQVNENFEVLFDEANIKKYLDTLFDGLNTVGKERDFHTTMGTTIKISGGDYGWLVDKSKEVENLIASVKEGQTVDREPKYSQTAISHDGNDIGNTYVEINMTRQHLWFYKDGKLIVEGDVVTGNVSQNHSTRVGVYRIKYKQTNTMLKGEDYNVPVSFWMPFDGGIGIHDARWRSTFGGNIYRTNGSHGCVNAPYYVANAVFNSIQVGNPVVCYYE
ncbi:peptidoglycan binding domain-containing protein [Clostridium sp. YIM B02551]|uniref:L,D-transpeptidase family protein n=1 Tax=Clostridium sp. YIM B02551 TaxID=2910679 RepID=UPI001EECBA16|nr:peptidoglycan binding domain-containing protein [Clostridium sp. YIM B02551]